MMDKTCRITLSIPGENRHIAIDVLLADVARKLQTVGSLSAGQHEILIFADGSIALNAAIVWEPPKTPAAPQQLKRKVG